MFYRICAILIIGFWMAMTSLLVVREFYPDATRLNQVPTSYVGRLIFEHHQLSDLQIYDAGQPIGFIRLEPHELAPGASPSLTYRGGVSINPPGLTRQQVSFSGEAQFNELMKLRTFSIGFTTQKPEHQLLVTLDIEKKTAHYEVRAEDHSVDQGTTTLDSAGLNSMLSRIGLDPALLQQLNAAMANVPAPEVIAQDSSIKVNGEKISTYLLGVAFGEQSVIQAHVTPLGQVIRAQMPIFGYTFSLYNLPP